MAKNKDPHFWLTVLKLVVGTCVFVGVVWLALWYANSIQESQPLAVPQKPKVDWGISKDSPLRNNR